jgi:tryptophan synthase alpha chain
VNRIDKKFKELKEKKSCAFISYITCGDPSISSTEKIIKILQEHNVDIIELGAPFSDPMADGPTIQQAQASALKHHVSLKKVLETAKRIRKFSDIPMAVMSYYNPIFHYGIRRFIKDAKKSGLDGLIIPDLPPDEGSQVELFARQSDLATIYFISSTSSNNRIKKAIRHSKGFIYYLSLTGVTGARSKLPKGIKKDVTKIKKMTNKPVCVGFGISNCVQVKEMCKVADGVIVGSAIINKIHQDKSESKILKDIKSFVGSLAKAAH